MGNKGLKYTIFISCLFFILIKVGAFDYEHQSQWNDSFKECGMQSQSPIEIITNETEVMPDYVMPAISFKLYHTPYTQPAKCENNGYTINIQLPKPKGYVGSRWQIYDNLSPHIMGGPLSTGAHYIAESVHFHWGSQDTRGSDHVIDGQRFGMEMHIVHRNSNYSTIEEAREHEDGIAVVAVLFKIEKTLEVDFLGLNKIITILDNVTQFNEYSEISNLTLADLLTDLDTNEFFSYAGSLTTPPCSQAVTWLIFSHTLQLSHEQMKRFHHISGAHNSMIADNYRSLQPKGNRKVYQRKVLKGSTRQATTEATI